MVPIPKAIIMGAKINIPSKRSRIFCFLLVRQKLTTIFPHPKRQSHNIKRPSKTTNTPNKKDRMLSGVMVI